MALIWLSGSLTMSAGIYTVFCRCEYHCWRHLLPILVAIPCGWGFISHHISHVKQHQMSNTWKYWSLTIFMQNLTTSRARALSAFLSAGSRSPLCCTKNSLFFAITPTFLCGMSPFFKNLHSPSSYFPLPWTPYAWYDKLPFISDMVGEPQR